MRIEFEDQGQDLLWLDVDDETGLITDCGPFHSDLYANKGFWVELESVEGGAPCPVFYYRGANDKAAKIGQYFRWPTYGVIDQ